MPAVVIDKNRFRNRNFFSDWVLTKVDIAPNLHLAGGWHL
jgi:hypothetical protein